MDLTRSALGQPRSPQRKVARGRDDEVALTAGFVALASRYGHRTIGALLKRLVGWSTSSGSSASGGGRG